MTFGSSEIHLIYAIGQDILSAWNDGNTKSESGTSMATPHVAGFVAYLLTLDSTLTPATVDSTIKSTSLKDVLTNIRKSANFSKSIGVARDSLFLSSADGTINALLNNGL